MFEVGELVVCDNTQPSKPFGPGTLGEYIAAVLAGRFTLGAVYTIEHVRREGEPLLNSDAVCTITSVRIAEVDHRVEVHGRGYITLVPASWFVPLRKSTRIDMLRTHLSETAPWGAPRKEHEHADV